jgi:hypothetical protein
MDRASVSQAVASRGDPAASANVARDLEGLSPWRDPGRTQTSFRLPQDLLPSPVPGIPQHPTPGSEALTLPGVQGMLLKSALGRGVGAFDGIYGRCKGVEGALAG